MIIIGIDPGKKGAFAVFDGEAVFLFQMPDNASDTANILSEYADKKVHVFLEKAQSMGGREGSVSMFNYGVGFGTLLGILASFKIPHTLVHPKTWCKVMHEGTVVTEPKARSLEAARRLFPQVPLVRPRCTKPDEGFVDALLLAGYGKRVLGLV
jgi:crossover junction endodeoxyribonuclease RuvC